MNILHQFNNLFSSFYSVFENIEMKLSPLSPRLDNALINNNRTEIKEVFSKIKEEEQKGSNGIKINESSDHYRKKTNFITDFKNDCKLKILQHAINNSDKDLLMYVTKEVGGIYFNAHMVSLLFNKDKEFFLFVIDNAKNMGIYSGHKALIIESCITSGDVELFKEVTTRFISKTANTNDIEDFTFQCVIENQNKKMIQYLLEDLKIIYPVKLYADGIKKSVDNNNIELAQYILEKKEEARIYLTNHNAGKQTTLSLENIFIKYIDSDNIESLREFVERKQIVISPELFKEGIEKSIKRNSLPVFSYLKGMSAIYGVTDDYMLSISLNANTNDITQVILNSKKEQLSSNKISNLRVQANGHASSNNNTMKVK